MGENLTIKISERKLFKTCYLYYVIQKHLQKVAKEHIKVLNISVLCVSSDLLCTRTTALFQTWFMFDFYIILCRCHFLSCEFHSTDILSGFLTLRVIVMDIQTLMFKIKINDCVKNEGPVENIVKVKNI